MTARDNLRINGLAVAFIRRDNIRDGCFAHIAIDTGDTVAVTEMEVSLIFPESTIYQSPIRLAEIINSLTHLLENAIAQSHFADDDASASGEDAVFYRRLEAQTVNLVFKPGNFGVPQDDFVAGGRKPDEPPTETSVVIVFLRSDSAIVNPQTAAVLEMT